MNARDDACDVALNSPKLATYYARGADEFLRAYFVLGLHNVRFNARYFVMAHCLELAFKATLASRSAPIRYRTHSLRSWMTILSDKVTPALNHSGPKRARAKSSDECSGELLTISFSRTG